MKTIKLHDNLYSLLATEPVTCNYNFIHNYYFMRPAPCQYWLDKMKILYSFVCYLIYLSKSYSARISAEESDSVKLHTYTYHWCRWRVKFSIAHAVSQYCKVQCINISLIASDSFRIHFKALLLSYFSVARYHIQQHLYAFHIQ